ncbi:DUF1146 family protein [Tepidibacillus fermentans]|uniref:Putative integral membrane protein (TIGR02327 family) n=1 Tax=Tepidibacillus fermentans TaxID=1281767 RepID=A0A4R3KIR9_9BACI|nr:DUF1146 family protein [Tepidibacillus fermentans]TCS83389.1 putative integral membrane protein (TIGR02327 family) [Tepidibacillus fermentans]
MESYFVYTSIVGIVVTLISIGVSWWALQVVRFDVFTFRPKSPQAIALQIILSIVIGYQLSRFLLDYVSWSYQLHNLIQ